MPQYPSTQQVVRIHKTGKSSVLTPETLEVPQPEAGQLLIKTAATGVNFIETYQRSGVYPVDLPFTPGSEAAGEVVALGEGVNNFSPGDRVVSANAQATYAQYFLVDANSAVLIPEEVSDETAVALALQGMTAHYLVRSTFEVKPEHTVLFHAGAGGVGGLALQLIKAIGATVITTVSTDEKEKIAHAHGADHVIRYEDFAQAVDDITRGQGVDVVYDSVGKDTFEQSLLTLKPRGMAVLFGGASGQVPPFDLQRLNGLGSLFVTRPTLTHYTQTQQEINWRMSELFKAVRSGKLTVTIDQRFALTEAVEAHNYLEARKTRGKVILIP